MQKMLNFKELARLGAAQRLRVLDAERAAILKTFPDLGSSAQKPVSTKRRRKMSVAGKAAIRSAMKRRWAEWRQKQQAKDAKKT